jgi:hypothetical protein
MEVDKVAIGSRPQAKVRGKPSSSEEPVSEDVASLDKEWAVTELPEWIQKFYVVFRQSVDWDKRWFECFKLYLKFEHRLGYTEKGGKIPLALRPPQIAAWFKNRRNPRRMMKVWTPEMGSAWREEWWAYWRSIQPKGRIQNNELVRPESLDWDKLRDKGGVD